MSCFDFHWRRWLNRVTPSLLGMGGACFLGAAASLMPAVPAAAAQRLMFTYGPIEIPLTTEQLETFAETGVLPNAWRFYFNIAKLDPEVVRPVISEEFPVSLKFLDRALNSLPGEYVLFRLGDIISTPSGRANIQALRAALVLSVVEDGRISLLEFVKNYPTADIRINVREALVVAKDVGIIVQDLRDVKQRLALWIASAQEVFGGVLCDCETSVSPAAPSPSVPSN